MKHFRIYTDGAYHLNPGYGGWAAVILGHNGQKRTKRTISGRVQMTSSNRMELTAVIQALAAIPSGSSVDVYSDSRYVVDAFTQGWLTRWKAMGWCRVRGDRRNRVKNEDLWKRLDHLCKRQHKTVRFHWIKGHAGQPENEEADRLATAAAAGAPRGGLG